MGSKSISLDYGTYDNFGYKKDSTTFDLTWEAPGEMEDKYVKAFDDIVKSDLVKLEKELNSGANEAKKWLAATDKQLSDIFKKWEKNGTVTKKEADFCDGLQEQLPPIIEGLEKQRVKVFESMLEKILDDAVNDIAAKFKLKITKGKIKKGLKIAAFAVITLTVAALALTAAILSFGLAVGPIMAIVGASIGVIGAGVGIAAKTKGVWSAGKDEAKALENSAKAYASATDDFNNVLARQMSQLSAKSAQLDVLEKQIAQSKKLLAQLDGLKKNAGDKIQTSIDKAMKELVSLEKAQTEMASEFKTLEKLVESAVGKKTYDAALALASTLKADRGVLDKIAEHFGTLSGLIGGISGV